MNPDGVEVKNKIDKSIDNFFVLYVLFSIFLAMAAVPVLTQIGFSILELSFALVAVVIYSLTLLIFYKAPEKYRPTLRITTIYATGAFICAALFIFGTSNAPYIYPLPIIAFFMLRRQAAIIFTTLLSITVLSFYAIDFLGLRGYTESTTQLAIHVMSFIYVMGLGYMVGIFMTKNETVLTDENQKYLTFKLAVEQAPSHITITDKDSKIIFANPAAEVLTGYKHYELIGQTPGMWNSFSSKGLPVAGRKLPDVGRASVSLVSSNINKKGVKYQALTNISPIFYRNRLLGYVDIEQDVSDQIRLEKRLEETNKQVESDKNQIEVIMQSIGDAVVALDVTGHIILANTKMNEMFGYPTKKLIGKHISKVLKAHDIEGNLVKEGELGLIQAYRQQKVTKGTYSFTRHDGTKFYGQFISAPLLFHNSTLGSISVIRDTTEEERVSKSKSEFVSLASHQLRNPLTLIGWYSEMLMSPGSGKLSSKQKRYLDEIRHGNKKMVQLVNSLLNISRLEMGTLGGDIRPSNARDLLLKVVAELQKGATDKKLKLSTEAPVQPNIIVDPRVFSIVFENILSNAIKYTPEGGQIAAYLDIQAKGSRFAGRKLKENSLCFSVADNGLGIPASQQSKIFSKMFRAQNAAEKVPEGMGLGLYLVKSIVDKALGEIWFNSELGKGTTFYAIIPVKTTEKQVESIEGVSFIKR